MKNLNRKGFTLIELLAVITIMGILMVVAIPTVSRTIENTRKDTFLDTAKQYVNGVKMLWTADSLECSTDGTNYYLASALSDGDYYVQIDSQKIESNSGIGSGTVYPIILEDGGKSSWGNKHVFGYVKVNVAGTKVRYYVYLVDGIHGIMEDTTEYTKLKRGNVLTEDVLVPSTSTMLFCKEV